MLLARLYDSLHMAQRPEESQHLRDGSCGVAHRTMSFKNVFSRGLIFHKCSQLFMEIVRNRRVAIPNYFGLFLTIPDYSGLFRTISDYFVLFQTISDYFGLFRTISDYFRLFRTIWDYSVLGK